MPKKGLTKERVVSAAVQLIEEKGMADFSMNKLAAFLDIKPASLYTHVESMETLLTEVGLRAVDEMTENEKQAIAGKQGDEALDALAGAYMDYAQKHYELYWLIMNIPRSHNAVLDKAGIRVTEPFLTVLSLYGLSEEEQMHYQRVLRSILHGFVAHKECGAFSHFPIPVEESYAMAIGMFTASLHSRQESAE